MEIQSEHAGGSRALPRISLTPEEAAASTGFSVRRIFQAIKDEKLTARKEGKATVIEFAELSRWVGTLPTRGRPQEPKAGVVMSDNGNFRKRKAPARTRASKKVSSHVLDKRTYLRAAQPSGPITSAELAGGAHEARNQHERRRDGCDWWTASREGPPAHDAPRLRLHAGRDQKVRSTRPAWGSAGN